MVDVIPILNETPLPVPDHWTVTAMTLTRLASGDYSATLSVAKATADDTLIDNTTRTINVASVASEAMSNSGLAMAEQGIINAVTTYFEQHGEPV
jgi:hypothetical protein